MIHLLEPGSVVSLSTGQALLIALAGLGAGIVNGVAGGGTLISFPVLLAMGYPALTANITNTVGIWPGYLGGMAGFRREIHEQRDRLIRLGIPALIGAVIGAVLLLTTPPADFARLAPWLILLASALFAAQPLLTRILSRHAQTRTHAILLTGGVLGTSVYGGYFGAGLGVMLLAVLGSTLPDSLVRTSGLRTVLSMMVNGIAAVVFIAHGSVSWEAAALLAAGSLWGGWMGALVVLRLPVPLLRLAIVLIGTATGLKLLVG